MPGWKEGISAAMIGGMDVGISKYIDEERKLAAAKVLDFFLSLEEQKRIVMNRKTFSGIQSLYNDDEVCSVVDCNLYRNLQLSLRYHQEREDYEIYNKNIRKYVYEFVNGNKTAAETLEKMNDLVYIYQITLNGVETYYGIILFIITIVLSIIIIGSFVFVKIERYNPLFEFLSLGFWYTILFGILCHLASSFTEYGETLPYKCHLKVSLYTIGYTFTFVPLLCKLISNFPKRNKMVKWTSRNKDIFFLIFVFFDIILIIINCKSSYDAEIIHSGNGKKYQECKMNDALSKISVYTNLGFKVMIFIGIGVLSFIEWNSVKIRFDVHLSILTIYINILSVIMMLIFKFIIFENYITYCILNKIFFFIIIISNYIIFIGVRIIYVIINRNKPDPFRNIVNYKNNNNSMISSQRTVKSNASSTQLYRYKRTVNYQYPTNISI